MAQQEDTNKGCVSRASLFTYCGKKTRLGMQVPMTEEAKKKYPDYPRQHETFNYELECGIFNEHWAVICDECSRLNSLVW